MEKPPMAQMNADIACCREDENRGCGLTAKCLLPTREPRTVLRTPSPKRYGEGTQSASQRRVYTDPHG